MTGADRRQHGHRVAPPLTLNAVTYRARRLGVAAAKAVPPDTPHEAVRAALQSLGEPYASEMAAGVEEKP